MKTTIAKSAVTKMTPNMNAKITPICPSFMLTLGLENKD